MKNTNKGITLIALVITIIVMLILTAVTISMAVNGGLFEYAQRAGTKTNEAKANEQEFANLEANMTVNELIDKYTGGSFPAYAEAKFENGYLTENATLTRDGYTAVVPKGFKIINGSDGTQSIAKGLVIQDASGNEFVWIPVTKTLGNSYTYNDLYLEPAEVALDEGKGYSFASEYQAMVSSVNTNDGFYIGRYETTTDTNSKIGSKYNTQILYGRNWYDLYTAQKTANVPGNGTNVQTAMIYGVLWDETMVYISQNDTNYDVNSRLNEWSGYINNYNLAGAGTFNGTDVALNIWRFRF